MELKQINLGGTGKMFGYEKDGKSYIFKPAITRSYPFAPLIFRAYAQEAAYYVQQLVDKDSSIVCFADTKGGMFGASQERIEVEASRLDLTKLTSNLKKQILREFVVDYLINNYDSHPKNFIIDKNGILRGIDKEQAFKYFYFKEAQCPSIDYHPNEVYGEREPVYNTIFKKFIKDTNFDIDFSCLEEYISKVEKFDTNEYMEFFSDFIPAFKDAFATNSQIAEFIKSKKENIREELYSFVKDVIQQSGKDVEIGINPPAKESEQNSNDGNGME